jgi:hypothetical protein
MKKDIHFLVSLLASPSLTLKVPNLASSENTLSVSER